MPFTRQTRRHIGYTLIELLTVCAIIGILSAMAIASVTKARVQAREAKAVAMIKGFVNIYTTYHAKYGVYPHWGPGQRYSSPSELWADLGAQGYIPKAWMFYAPAATDLVIRGPVDGYVVEILEYQQDAGNLRSPDTYFAIVFRPFGFQERYLGVSVDPALDRASPVPLFGDSPDITTYRLRPIADQ